MIKGIIIGMLVWQVVVMLVCILSNEDEEITIRTGMGVFNLGLLVVGFLYKKVSLIKSRKYNYYQFFGLVSESNMESKADKHIDNFYMTEKVASQFKQVGKDEIPTEDYSIRLLKEGKSFKSAPYKQDILTQKKIDNGFKGFTPEFLNKFKKRVDR